MRGTTVPVGRLYTRWWSCRWGARRCVGLPIARAAELSAREGGAGGERGRRREGGGGPLTNGPIIGDGVAPWRPAALARGLDVARDGRW
jgi:hypothetical protein